MVQNIGKSLSFDYWGVLWQQLNSSQKSHQSMFRLEYLVWAASWLPLEFGMDGEALESFMGI
jgi:hypothetical protein